MNDPSEGRVVNRVSALASTAEEPIAETKLRTKVRAGFAVAILLTCLLSCLSWRMARQMTDDAGWVAHTHQVSTALEATLRHLLDVETGGRGFAVTGDELFLEPYESGRPAVVQDLAELHHLLRDPSQVPRMKVLEAQAIAEVKCMEEIVAMRQNSGEGSTLTRLKPGKDMMDAARVTIAEMEDAQEILLEQRTRRARAAQYLNSSVVVLGAILGGIFLSIAGATVSREIGISARSRAQVIFLNADLERRVEQRTEALGESEGRLAGVIQSAMDSIITVDEEYRIVLFNGAAEKVFRCPAAEAIGQSITRFIPQRFHGVHAEHIRRFGETGVTSRAMGTKNVLSAVRADGKEFPIEASISQVVTSGKKKLFTVILRDVTERTQAEAMRERLAAIVESSDDAIISKTLDGTITAWNHGAEKVFGYPSSEAVGKKTWMIIPTDRAHEEIDILERIGRGESVEHYETRRVRKDGKTIDVSVTISPIRNSKGTVVGASKVARDITERKHAEEALRDSEQRFQAMANGIPQLAWMAEADGRIFWYNQRWYDYTGTTFEQMEGWAWQTVHDPAMLPKVLEKWKGSIATGDRFDMEFPLRGADGVFRTFLTRVVPVRDTGGRVVRWFGTNTDISEGKQAEQARLLAEERYRRFVERTAAGVLRNTLDGRILESNDAMVRMLGYDSRAEFLSRPHPEIHYVKPEERRLLIERLKQHGALSNYEACFQRKDGKPVWVVMSLVLVRDEDEAGDILEATVIDVTARKEAEQQLATQAEELFRQTEELGRSRQALEAQTLMLQSILDGMDEGLVAANEDGKLIIWNPAAEKILGRGPVEMPNEQWSAYYGFYLPDMITPLPLEQDPLWRAVHGEANTTQMFVRNPQVPNGVWIEVNASPLREKSGASHGGVVAFRDVTAARAAEREIRELNEELEGRVVQRTAQLQAANRELESFTYSVSHDLRAPLRHIAGFAGACLEEFGTTVDPQALHYLQRIQDGTHRMGLLINELLNLSRTGQRSVRLQVTALNSVVQETISMLKAETEGREVEWKVDNLPSVECDLVLIRQVFQNLLSNAVKYSRRRPHAVIEIGHMREDGQQIIFVRDNGAGFNMQHADKLFGVFQRLHREEEFEGTGVGLATVQRIVQKHGGRIWAEAELDRGATFYFTLGGNEIAGSRSDAATAGG